MKKAILLLSTVLIMHADLYAQTINFLSNYHRVTTPSGYIDIGPQNSSWAHIYSDRAKFIFNKPVYSIGGLFSSHNSSLTLQTNGVSRLFINQSNGNIGIGNTNPLNKLEIGNTFSFHDGGHKIIGLGYAPGTGDMDATKYGAEVRLDPANGDLRLGTTATITEVPTTRMTITSIGDVGIGYTSPNAQLVVGNAFGATVSGSGGGNAVFGTNLAIYGSGANANQLYTPQSHSNNYGYAGMHAKWGDIYFYAAGGNTTANNIIAPSTRMLIKSNGYVGIGNNAPTEKLDVAGNIKVNRMVKIDGQGSVASLQVMDNTNTGTVDVLLRGDGGDSYIKSGEFAIGTTTVPSGYKLAVDGKIISEEVKVQVSSSWPDFVFSSDYKLMPLEEIEEFIQSNHHLPEMPSAQEVEANGFELGEMNRLLLQKIEELTLHAIAHKKKMGEMMKLIKAQQEEIEKLKTK